MISKRNGKKLIKNDLGERGSASFIWRRASFIWRKKVWMVPVPAVIVLAVAVLGGVGIVGALNGWFGGGGSIPSDTFTRGLVGYWSFEEGSGIRAHDGSGNGNNGTLNYMATNTNAWTAGKVGSALQFDGTDDYVSVGNVGNIRTVEFWINDANAADGILELINDATHISISGSAIVATGFTSPTIYVNGSAASASLASGWNHVVVTDTADVAAVSFLIGEANNDYLSGKIDEVKIYSRALSAAEVRYHYNRGGPVAYWKFNEGEGSVLYNSATIPTTSTSTNGHLYLAPSGNTATSSAWVTGRYGSALNFDGTDDYVDAGNDTIFDITDAITMEAWVYDPPLEKSEIKSTKFETEEINEVVAQKLAQAPEEIKEKYQVDGDVLKRIAKADQKDRIEVTIGNDEMPDIALKRWDEVWFDLKTNKLLENVPAESKSLEFSGSKILYNTPEMSFEIYEYFDDEGGMKYIWYLNEKPPTNRIEFEIESDGLDFFYQPPLTQEYQNGYSEEFQKEIVVSETQVKDLEGNVLVERPENVVGSYAVYHQTKGGMNDINGKEHKVGKAFHIYRPHIIDAEGKEIWGILHIENGIYSVEIPQEFLDTAVYPIKSNDTFGYTGIGGSFDWNAAGRKYANGDDVTGAAGTLVSMSSYGANGTNIQMGIYDSSGNRVDYTGSVAPDATAGWDTANVTVGASVSAVGYALAFMSQVDNYRYYYDAVGTNNGRTESITGWAGGWPATVTWTTGAVKRRYSLYATYEPTEVIIIGKGEDAYEIGIDSDLIVTGRINTASTVTAQITKAWHYVAMTYNGSVQKLYIDGTLRDSASLAGAINTNATHLQIGKNVPGKIDDVRIYNYARTDEEIRLDYNAGFAAIFGPSSDCDRDPGSCMTQGLVGYWNMEDGSGTKASDASGNANNGTLKYMSTSTNAWTEGKVGGALQFDGTDDYVSVGNVGNVRTVEFWINDANAADGILELINDATHISISGSAIVATGFTSPTIYVNGSAASASLASGWNHVVVTDTADVAAVSFLIGEANTDYSAGKLDEVKLYSRALSPAEIRYHYNRGGPVAQWKFDEGEGRTAYDSTDNNKDGTLVLAGSATSSAWVAGKYGGALSFDGTDDYLRSNSNITGVSFFSYSLWFQSSDGSLAADEYLFSQGTNDPSIHIAKATSKVVVMADNATTTTSVKTVNDTKWHHVQITADGATIKLYLDGILESQASYTGSSATGVLNMAANATPGSYFGGIIDDVRIYDYARTPDEIRLDYNAGLAAIFGPSSDCDRDPGSCMTQGLVGYWPFDEGSGTIAYDHSATNNNGTIDTSTLYTTGKVGPALDFDPTDSGGVDLGTAHYLYSNVPMTVEGWVWVRAFTETYPIFIGLPQGDGAARLYIVLQSTRICYWGVSAAEACVDYATAGLDFLRKWRHIALVYNGNGVATWTNYKLYVDGVLMSPYSVSVGGGQNKSEIGTRSDYAGAQFDGVIDEVRIYNRALSAAEVRYHYNHGAPVALWKFDEGEGRTAFDSTDNNNDGTLVLAGSATSSAWVAGKYGSALSFDGSDDYVKTNSNIAGASTTAYSLWFKSADGSFAADEYLFSQGTNDPSVHIAKATNKVVVIADNTTTTTSVKTVNDTKWHHLEITADGQITKLYLDGILESQASYTGSSATGVLNMAADATPGSYFGGIIDDVRIYNYARTQEQIRQDYNAGLATHFR